jgi:hypothetical protein
VAPTFVADVPQNEDPQNDASNFAFARVSRNAAGSAETVDVEFLVAEFGTGSPYASVVTTTVSFGAADLTAIATAPWTLAPTSSTHLCLGAQISTASDPFVTPGLNGNTPGWPTTDLMVINDNNKGQRNMSLHYGMSGFGSIHYFVVRNASKKPRDFVLGLRADPKVLKSLANPTVQVQGGDQAVAFKPDMRIELLGMRAGEYRWVAFGVDAFKGKARDQFPVDFLEVVDDKIVNGCRVNLVAATATRALKEHLLFAGSVMQRLNLQFKLDSAADVAAAARELASAKTVSLAAYLRFLVANRDALSATVDGVTAARRTAVGLDIASSWQAVQDAVDGRDARTAFARMTTLLNQLDIVTTLVQKSRRR